MTSTTYSDNSFDSTLISWYLKHKRDLPWRETTDPYKIWLSEIILQQTRVQQGLPYYERFVAQYPTVKDFAAAPQDEILRLWQGLGYYSRARNMHTTANHIVDELGGTFPTSYKELLKLKGVGKYTAAAIASFAFKEKVASVDGNVYRVLSRVFGMADDIASPKGQQAFSELANSLISEEHPDLFNQALMEFGAIQCTPANPNCMFCPFAQECVARSNGEQSSFPVKTKKVKVKKRFLHYLVFEHKGMLLMKQRKGKDIWQGLFDFYLIERDKFLTFDALISSLSSDEIWGTGLLETAMDNNVKESPDFKHILTHQRLSVRFFKVELPNAEKLQELSNHLGMSVLSIDEVNDSPKPILIENYLKEYIY
ncbi:A/G-specific adenine glycosylase [Limibacter armeniacum]|uniref:A/G-specific adenine glycosylase n=1 Tax=Limibacter armeniacum TaxID=466084 RepID=UPI002FE5BC73